jgi:hypothetical protein
MRKLDRFLPVVLFSALFFASAVHAETPCDFKGVSVGNKMTAAQIMTAFGVTNYKANPALPDFDERMPAVNKYGIMPAGELEDWKIGPYCDDSSCRIPYGVSVGNHNDTPVSVFISFDATTQITEIDVSFSTMNWDDLLPILDQKYGPDWTVKRDDMPITDMETKKRTDLERITLTHVTNGTNPSSKTTCEIWASNLDIVFEHHDPLGPFHSTFVIKLISKNF